MDTFEWLMKLMVAVAMGAGTLVLVRVAVLGNWRPRHRLRGEAEPPEVAQLHETVERLNGEVAELQERVDFTERMLAQQRDRALPADRE
jgi:hypothetical protein